MPRTPDAPALFPSSKGGFALPWRSLAFKYGRTILFILVILFGVFLSFNSSALAATRANGHIFDGHYATFIATDGTPEEVAIYLFYENEEAVGSGSGGFGSFDESGDLFVESLDLDTLTSTEGDIKINIFFETSSGGLTSACNTSFDYEDCFISPQIHSYVEFTRTGGVWSMTGGYVAPAGTRVTSVIAPAHDVVTNPLDIEFEYFVTNADDGVYSSYEILFKHKSGARSYLRGDLLDSTSGYHSFATTTSIAELNGSWSAEFAICTDEGQCTSYVPRSFWLNERDQFGDQPGETEVIFPAESCEFSLNPFEESEWSFGDCMGYLFHPGVSLWERYATLGLETRFPFAYAYDIGEARQTLFGQTATEEVSLTVTTDLGDITFLSAAMLSGIPFVDLLRLILGWFCYLVTAETIYRRVLKAHDSNTAT